MSEAPSPDTIRDLAREYSADAVELLGQIMTDKGQDIADRIRAATRIIEVGGFLPPIEDEY